MQSPIPVQIVVIPQVAGNATANGESSKPQYARAPDGPGYLGASGRPPATQRNSK
jgi:hypothetical protein